jgi:uncharacterized protein (TIGR02271 family)
MARAIRAFFKAAMVVLAVAVLARFLRDRFGRSGDAVGRAPDRWPQRETEDSSTLEGEERTDKTPEREDELRVQRTEEELSAGTREREAGEVRVRKEVRTDSETVEVPIRREEVHVDRVPLEGEVATEAQIGDEEVSVPVTEEEVVVEKRPVVKEEVRIRKDVVEDTEVVEEDVRREEIDIDDQTNRRDV